MAGNHPYEPIQQGMPRLIIAPEASREACAAVGDAWQDLRESREHNAKDNPMVARRVVMRLRKMACGFAGAPALGRVRPELGADLRSFVADRHVLFYRPLKGTVGIELARVLHGAREIDAIFLAGKE